MGRIEKGILETLFGKMIEERELEVSGFKKPLTFEIYDGYAYCPDFKGHEYGIEYPRLSLIEKSKELQEDIRKRVKLNEDDPINIIHVIQTFNMVYRDGVNVSYDSKSKSWVEVKK